MLEKCKKQPNFMLEKCKFSHVIKIIYVYLQRNTITPKHA